MLKKYYLSKGEVKLIQIALGEFVIYEKKKLREDKELIRSCKNLISKLEGTKNEKAQEKSKRQKKIF